MKSYTIIYNRSDAINRSGNKKLKIVIVRTPLVQISDKDSKDL